ncbi:cache domain-containing protein [Argonema antarcticum]|uniref:PDC sensor domain-containing protein n=1 Tax=Argonema antarcticum TaxID=2942763 RepID=UPI0020111DD7|nr:cache domain-containing protein [Argonema antarcticum]MCL1469299.1 hypothetical protein [Argonema antarcticum A004/B2]
MKTNSRSNQVFRITLILCGLSLIVVLTEIFGFWKEQNRTEEIAKTNAKQEVVRASKQLEEKLRKLQDTANAIARELTESKLTDEQLPDRAKKELEQNPDFLEVGAVYKPFAYNRNRRLYGPYYTRKSGQIERVQLENYYDYTQPENDWYYKVLAKGAFWLEPEFDQASETIVADYYVAFDGIDPQTKQKTPRGIIFANFSLEKLKDLIDSLDVGKSGYGFLISKKGVLISHPKQEYVLERKTLFDLANEQKNQQFRIIGEKAIQGKSAVIDLVDNITGQSAWVFVEPIHLNGWSMAVVMIKDDSGIDFQTKRRQLIRIALETIGFLFFLSIIVFGAYKGRIGSLWAISSTASVLSIAVIGFIWYIAFSEQTYKNNRNLLLSKTTVDNLLEPQAKLAEKLKQKPPLYVTTGLFIQSLKFNSANDVFVTGYIWQKFKDGVHDGLSRGFILPEGSDVEINEAYRYKEDQTEVIGWYFEATLRQNFDFSNYPFDYNDVWVRLWPKDFQRKDLNRTVILVPDFRAYDVLNPIVKPGLEADFVSESWDIESSFFEYKLNNYNTNFGIPGSFVNKNYPELYFTIILKRAFLGILIARIVPLSVVSILLFAIMLLSRNRGMEVVGACGGFIFIVILDQISVRGQIAAKGIIYIEYFYFAIYLFILLVAVNAILLNSDRKNRFLEYKDNLLPKLLYWPTILNILLIVTASIFY